MSQQKQRKSWYKRDLLPVIVLSLVVGSFILALIDKNIRITFADLAKVGVGGYIALMVPPGNNRSGRPK